MRDHSTVDEKWVMGCKEETKSIGGRRETGHGWGPWEGEQRRKKAEEKSTN